LETVLHRYFVVLRLTTRQRANFVGEVGGSEFADWEGIERSCLNPSAKRLTLYYAHAYRACERGTNENHNGFCSSRRELTADFFPKGTDFSKVTDDQVSSAVRRMNNYPRKILNGLTPLQSFTRDKASGGRFLFQRCSVSSN
jgi:IS30 family transposase